MPANVYQRYLLLAVSPATNIPISGQATVQATTVPVPLGVGWTVRIRRIDVGAQPQDASGSVQIESIRGFWSLNNSAGTAIISVDALYESLVTPPYTFNKLSFVGVQRTGDAWQTVSSLDQIGGVATNITAVSVVSFNNTDATNPHPVVVSCTAILEFEGQGASD